MPRLKSTPQSPVRPDRVSDRRPPRPAETGSSAARPAFNDAESPLAWLRSRKDKTGRPLISSEQYLAGEKLRSDFERAMLQRRVTQNWDLATAGRSGANVSAGMSDGAIAAGQRFHAAVAAVGPELSSILVQVCCLSAGIEQAERLLELPQRSGKAVLGLALTGLARHYGLLKQPGQPAQHRTSQWSLPGYRPRIQATEEV